MAAKKKVVKRVIKSKVVPRAIKKKVVRKKVKRKIVKKPARKITKKKTVKKIKRKSQKRTVKKRTSKKETPSDAEVFYMGISNPIEVRKNVLESARDMVQFLQMFEKFRIIREEKKQAALLLKKHIKELNALTNKLKLALPKANFRTKTKAQEMPKVEQPKQVKMVEEAPKQSELPDIDVDDIEALETELRDIEDKLNFI